MILTNLRSKNKEENIFWGGVIPHQGLQILQQFTKFI